VNASDGRRLAVVTGASSGIGRELAQQAAGHGYDVVLVARREQRLHALAEELRAVGVTARPVAADLSEPSGVERVVAAVAGAPVDVVVNDAGVGGRGAFAVERSLAADLAMIRLNVTALVQLTGLFLPGMIERGHGGVLNVASIAGYLPGPGQAVYNASKAFVKSFSQALAEETRGTGVRVSALCPGPVRTEFAQTAGYRQEVRGNPLMPVQSAAEVAAAGWDGLMAGRAVIVPDLPTRIGLQALRFVPWQLIARTAGSPRRPTRTGDEP
jgi:short-subunit dehydrogenase